MTQNDAVEMIQYSLAPGLMISSSALFLSSLQSRFSNLFIRFRSLNHERRNLDSAASASEKDKLRLASVTQQLNRLFLRVRFIKNAIISLYLAILCFVSTCISLFFARSTSFPVINLGLGMFFAGMLLILTAAVLLIIEVSQAYHILKVERRS